MPHRGGGGGQERSGQAWASGPPLPLCLCDRYSITISIFVLFCIVKAFSYFGIIDFDD